ncbi:MAG: ArsR/SmtB family transcription factor [Coriobacteriales bacterium]
MENGRPSSEEAREVAAIAKEFEQSHKILTALGDETRQHLIIVMMQSGNCEGLRVNDIASRTSLSRPAVSHHLQILKDAGIVKMRKEGTRNFYYFDETAKALDQLIKTLSHAKRVVSRLPDRSDPKSERFAN